MLGRQSLPRRDSVWEMDLAGQGVRPGPCFSTGLKFIAGDVRGDLWERTGWERPPAITGVGSMNGAVGIRGIDIPLADKAGPNLSGDP